MRAMDHSRQPSESRKQYEVFEAISVEELEEKLNVWGQAAWSIEHISFVERSEGGKKNSNDLEQFYLIVMSRSV